MEQVIVPIPVKACETWKGDGAWRVVAQVVVMDKSDSEWEQPQVRDLAVVHHHINHCSHQYPSQDLPETRSGWDLRYRQWVAMTGAACPTVRSRAHTTCYLSLGELGKCLSFEVLPRI